MALMLSVPSPSFTVVDAGRLVRNIYKLNTINSIIKKNVNKNLCTNLGWLKAVNQFIVDKVALSKQ